MVTRCVCHGKSFAELKKIAKKQKSQIIEELMKHAIFGQNCQRCHPYIMRMLETGQTRFDLIEE